MKPLSIKLHINQLYAFMGIILTTVDSISSATTTTTPRPTKLAPTTTTSAPTTTTSAPTTTTSPPTTTTSTVAFYVPEPVITTNRPSTPSPTTTTSAVDFYVLEPVITTNRPSTPAPTTDSPGPTTRSILPSSINIPTTTNIMYKNHKLDDNVVMDYSLSYEGVTPIECGRLCSSIPGCRLFNYQNNSCSILNTVNHGLGSVTVNSIYVDVTVKETCQLPGYTAYIGGLFCIKPVEQPASDWMASNTTCNEDGGYLLIMRSVVFDVKKYVLETINLPEIPYWIGGNDLDVDGVWKWSDGSPIISGAWSPGNPSNVGECLMLHGLAFNDAGCGNILPFICEKSTVFDM
ncbi:C-type mannose receptor 2 [Patella vulgata]|uniref:C-type mannose receptor 2 n=1 Tax=Patella vulgata TaxID=6465 RepID=UPI00218063A1|nr:C-type mannose receptor 2 [Patella vulgata]